MSNKIKNILCLGGSGNLGTNVLKALTGHALTNIDYRNSSLPNINNVLLTPKSNPKETLHHIVNNINKSTFDAIIVTAGGWIGGNIKSQTLIQDYQKMRDMNLLPTLFAAHLATKFLNKQGLVVFTGAAAVFRQSQPEMIGYALAKTGVHSLALNLSSSKQIPEDTTVLTILPETIDTPQNRLAMPNAKFDEWSKPNQIAQLLKGWVQGINRPSTGSFMVLKVKNGIIVPQFV